MLCLTLISFPLLLPVSPSLGFGLLGVAACVLLVSTLALVVAYIKKSPVDPKV